MKIRYVVTLVVGETEKEIGRFVNQADAEAISRLQAVNNLGAGFICMDKVEVDE